MIKPITQSDQAPVAEDGKHGETRGFQYARHVVGLILLLLAVLTPSNLWGQAAQAPVLAHQFFTSTGAICSTCKLYSYAAGTTTPLNTYTTTALNVANPNPIILDTAGRVPGASDIYLAAVSYKFELQTAAGAVVWTRDNISASLTAASLAAIISAPTAYTPVWTATGTAPAIGNGTIVGRYQQTGKMVDYRILVTFGSTTTFGTGAYSFTLPITAASAQWVGGAYFFDDSATSSYIALSRIATTTTVGMFTNASPSFAIGATVPFTWASLDQMWIQGAYEVP